jgi:hypothetical protein
LGEGLEYTPKRATRKPKIRHASVRTPERLTAARERLKMAVQREQRNQNGRLNRMSLSKEDAVEKARKDLAQRLKIDAGSIKEQSVEDSDFPDMALGAPEDGEMSGQMISDGWRIRLGANGQTYEYRADKNQVRLYKYKGKNYRI